MAEPAADRPAYAQYADKYFVTKKQMETNVAAMGKAIGDILVPFQKRIEELEAEVALLRALGPSATPAKGKAKGK